MDFIKMQNQIYAGEILEGILIIIFSLAFEADKTNSFKKYIYNNLSLINDINCSDIYNWFDIDKFKQEELKNLKKLGIIEYFAKEKYEYYKEKTKYIIFNILSEIYKSKYIENYLNKKKYQISINYIQKMTFNKHTNTYKNIVLQLSNLDMSLSTDITNNSLLDLISTIYLTGEFGKVEKNILAPTIKSLLTKVYIYYQNKNFPFMSTNNKELAQLPITYYLDRAKILEDNAETILSPARIEPRINHIILTDNQMKQFGLYNLSKTILLNQNIKIIDYDFSSVKSYQINYFNLGLGLFDNYSIEDLNLSFNHIKEDSKQYLGRLISHLKGLKTINLSYNNLQGGISFFFIMLKNLYRKGKTKLEKLYINKCYLDIESFYELGELLKSKYCKLKKLYLDENIIPLDKHFLKCIKKNKSLIEIHLSGCDINNNDIDDINRIINNTDIFSLYLYKNKITNFNQLLKIIYRTKLVKNKNDNEKYIHRDESTLKNLDLSNNNILIKNVKHIDFVMKIIDETNLGCLDISQILYNQNKNDKEIFVNKYKRKIDELISILEKDKNRKIKNMKDFGSNQIDLKRYEILDNKDILNKFKNVDKEINEIIKNKNSKFPVFLKVEGKKLIENNKDIFKDIYENDIINKEKYKKLEDNLVKYMIIKRSEENNKVLKKGFKNEKLIII